MSSSNTFIGAVEIGTSKITVLIGEYTGRELAIIGRGECASHGVIKGTVVDYKAASDCTHRQPTTIRVFISLLFIIFLRDVI